MGSRESVVLSGEQFGPRSRPSILVVEDERVVAMDLAGTLEDLGYDVAGVAARAEAAIRSAAELQPSLILMDIRLAGEAMDGIEIAEVIQRSQDVPVVYLTAHSDSESVRRAAAASAAGYLVKPFRSPDLRCAIEIALHVHAAGKIVRERERWLAVTLQSVAEAVIATDNAGHIKLFNTVAEVMTGWSSQDARQTSMANLFAVVHEQTGEPMDDVLKLAIESRCSQHPQENLTLVSRSGQRIPVEELAAPILDDHGNVFGGVLVLRDITERRNQIQEIKKLNEELEDRVTLRTAELMEANRELETFSYSVAHDLRAPLRAIGAFNELMSEQQAPPLDGSGYEYLGRIRSAVLKMNELIDGLLSLAGVGRREMRPARVDICALAHEIAAEVAAAYPAHSPRFDADVDAKIMTDPVLLRMILRNLLDNAWKFTKGTAAPAIFFGKCEVRGVNAFYVKDNGAGFDPRYTGKLFEAFQRLHTERAFPGTGVGLAIVERAVHRLGGAVWADSQPGNGATFYFTLPSLQ